MHHGADAESADLVQGDAVLGLDVGLEGSVAGLEAVEDLGLAVGPVAVDERVLPVEGADGDGLVVGVVEDGLHAGRAVLDAQGGAAGLDIGDDLLFGLAHRWTPLFVTKRDSPFLSSIVL